MKATVPAGLRGLLVAAYEPEATWISRQHLPSLLGNQYRKLTDGEVLLEQRERLAETRCRWSDDAVQTQLMRHPPDSLAWIVRSDVGEKVFGGEANALLRLRRS